MRRLAPVLLLALLTACGSNSSPTATKSTPTATATPSPTTPTATAQQYASVVASSEAAIRKAYRAVRSCALDVLPPTYCTLNRLTAAATADTLAVRLKGAYQPSSHVYIGPPPAGIAALVRSTVADALVVYRGGIHKTAYGVVELEAGKLVSDLDGWKPYGA